MIKHLRRLLGKPSYYHSTSCHLSYHDKSSAQQLYNIFQESRRTDKFERDGQILEMPFTCRYLLDSLANPYYDSFNVISFGGSFGTTFWALKSLYPRLHSKIRSWKVIELPPIVEIGNQNILDEKLSFSETLSKDDLESSIPTIAFFSGSLQYIPLGFRHEYISKLSFSKSIKYLVLDRTLMHPGKFDLPLFECDRTYEHDRWYQVTALSEPLLIKQLASKSFQLFDSSPTLGGYTFSSRKRRLTFRSLLFTKPHTSSNHE